MYYNFIASKPLLKYTDKFIENFAFYIYILLENLLYTLITYNFNIGRRIFNTIKSNFNYIFLCTIDVHQYYV